VLTGGSKKTVDFANKHNKPVLHTSRDGGPAQPAQALLRFIDCHGIKVLNVAGPRASKEPEVYGFVKEVLAKGLYGAPAPGPAAAEPVKRLGPKPRKTARP
jgi:hypothetical protein